MIKNSEKKCTIRLRCVGPDNLYVAGDFNRWRVPGVEMSQLGDGLWETQVPLRPDAQQLASFTCTAGRVRGVLSERVDAIAKPTPTQQGGSTMSTTNAPIRSRVNHADIAKRAYEFYLQEGKPWNRALDHWLKAERELLACERPAAAKRAARKAAVPV